MANKRPVPARIEPTNTEGENPEEPTTETDEPVTDPVDETVEPETDTGETETDVETPETPETEPEDKEDEPKPPPVRGPRDEMPPRALGMTAAPSDTPAMPATPVDPAVVETTPAGLKFGWQQPPVKAPKTPEACLHMAQVQARKQLAYQEVGHEWVCTCGTIFEVVVNAGGKKTLKERKVVEVPVEEVEVVE